MEKLQIQDILRAQGVKRWTIVETVRQQSIAEHSFNVCFIARDIARRAGLDDWVIIKAALDHDLDEIITGDIPTPAKSRMRERGMDPDIIHDGRKTYPADIEQIVKLADMMESVWFLDSFGVGSHAATVRDELADALAMKIMDHPNPAVRDAAVQTLEDIRYGEFVI